MSFWISCFANSAAFITVAFDWELVMFPSLSGIGNFSVEYVDFIVQNTTSYDLSSFWWQMATTYGSAAFTSTADGIIPLAGEEINANVTSYLYSTPLGALAYHTYNNLSSLDDYITQYPTFDTVIIRGVLSLRTDIWALETRSTNVNQTCKMWVAQTSIGGPYDLALQFCLSSQNGSDPYLIAGEDSML
jgi:hypothetical protein